MAAEDREAGELLELVEETKPVLLNTDRVTVRAEAHYEHFKEDPVSVQCVYEFETGSTEGEVYQRRIKVKYNWQQLDCGWVEKLGLLYLKNNTGVALASVPTKEEEEAARLRVVQVWIGRGPVIGSAAKDCHNALLIRPGRFLMIEPESKEDIWLRCCEGEAILKLTAFPG